jgi:hypothetical protein
MAKQSQILANQLIPGVDKYALVSLKAACSVLDPEMSEERWALTRVLNEQPMIDGKRVWYQFAGGSIGDCYISVHPGEHRTDRPNGLNDIVLTPPPPPADDTLTRRLLALVDFARTFSIHKEEVDDVATTVRDFAAKRTSPYGAELFAQASDQVREGRGNRQELTQALYYEGLLNHTMPLLQFSAAMALFQLQAMTGQWVDPEQRNPYLEPIGSLNGFMRAVAASEHRRDLEKALAMVGNNCYRDGGESVKSAINSPSLVALSRHLVNACHQYLTALFVARNIQREKLNTSLNYRLIQADEGYACAQSGIFNPADFLFNDPEGEARGIARAIASGKPEANLTFFLSTPFWPRYTKRFARTLVAQARTLLASQLEQGIRELHELEKEYGEALGEEVEFERGWIDSALLRAYRVLGDEERVKRYATRIAGRLVVLMALAERG